MKMKTTIKLLLLGCVATVLLGVYKHQKQLGPEDLGLHRARIDDTGLIELRIDQIRQALKTGKPDAVLEMLPDQPAAAPALKSAPRLQSASGAENEFATALAAAPHDIALKTADITFSDAQAVFQGWLAASSGEKMAVQLTFKKVNHVWKLSATDDFFDKVQAFQKQAPAHLTSEDDFELFHEPSAQDKTLEQTALSPEYRIEKLTRSVTVDKLGRKLFSKPYAGVLFSSVTQLEHAPYLSARYVQLVTDPAWNRIVYGDYDGWIKAYGGTLTGPHALNRPHGIDRDSFGNVYVADTGNNRIVVLKLQGTGEDTELQFAFSFGKAELSRPYDVAWDDGGTPFDATDDRLWVADAGNNRVVGYRPANDTAEQILVYGQTGAGSGQFFDPRAVAVGRFNGVADNVLYVADTGNRRLVKLLLSGDSAQWLAEKTFREESQLTAIDVDHWGNVYVSDRSYREVEKLSADLLPIAEFGREGDQRLVDPGDFHVVFGQVYLQATDEKIWAGYDQAFALEKWSENSGAARLQLGLDVKDLRIAMSAELDRLTVSGNLTDHSDVTLVVSDAETGATVRQIPLGWLVPGEKEIPWDRRDDLGWMIAPGYYKMQVVAKSGYGDRQMLKESPELYLPLFYREDSGADRFHDAHLVQGKRSNTWGSAPSETIAEHPSEVIYRFEDLNPTAEYEIKAEFLNKAGDYLKQRITVGGVEVIPGFEVPSGTLELGWVQLPRESYSDGSAEIHIAKIAGSGPALISQLWVREANYDPASPPARQDELAAIPEAFALLQNYPNPFNPSTTIQFALPQGKGQLVKLRVYNMLGQTVKVLVNEFLPPGLHSVVWNGRDLSGQPAASGVYFYQLTAGDFNEVKKLILMK